jgi:hypothetical protein
LLLLLLLLLLVLLLLLLLLLLLERRSQCGVIRNGRVVVSHTGVTDQGSGHGSGGRRRCR